MNTHPASGEPLVMGSGFGRRLPQFVDQFGHWPAGSELLPRLVLTLHPKLHDVHLRDTVHDIALVSGVIDVEIVSAGIGQALRAVLAGYNVRLMRGEAPDGDSPLIVLRNPLSDTVLICAEPGDLGQTLSQSTLDLGQLVGQALAHENEQLGGVDVDDEDVDLGLRCEACLLSWHPVLAGTDPGCPQCGHDRSWVHVSTAATVAPPVD